MATEKAEAEKVQAVGAVGFDPGRSLDAAETEEGMEAERTLRWLDTVPVHTPWYPGLYHWYSSPSSSRSQSQSRSLSFQSSSLQFVSLP